MKKSNFRIAGAILGMALMASIVACGAATGKDTRYTNIEFGYSITLQPSYEVTEDEANSTVTIGTSEGTAIDIVVIEGDGPFRNDDLDPQIDRLNELAALELPGYEVVYRSNHELESGQIARIQLLSGKVPNDPENCIRHRYTLDAIYKGRLYHLVAMPCEDSPSFKDVETMINSLEFPGYQVRQI